MPEYIKKKFVTVKRSSAGLGLFADGDIKKNGLVVEYRGRVVPNKIADDMDSKYLFEINSRKTIDGSTRKNIARYINHSCKPNCEPEIKKGRVFIFAKKNIKAGEEITYDYGKEYFNHYIKPYGCRCFYCVNNGH